MGGISLAALVVLGISVALAGGPGPGDDIARACGHSFGGDAIKGRRQASYKGVMSRRADDRVFLASDTTLPSLD